MSEKWILVFKKYAALLAYNLKPNALRKLKIFFIGKNLFS